VREALGSMLAAELVGAVFLDLYAGSGAVGLEALSRGAGRVVWVESNRRTVQILRGNAAALGAGTRGTVVCADCLRWLAGPAARLGFGIAYADPPYEATRVEGLGRLMSALSGVLAPGGLFVAEQPDAMAAEERKEWRLLRDRRYGQTRLALYRLETAGTGRPGRPAAPERGATC
jgi:16S rRNA (guanine966-N2)-methyltransferase